MRAGKARFWNHQTSRGIGGRKEGGLEKRNPLAQPLLRGEREDEEPRVARCESVLELRLAQLRQMLITIESAQVA